MHISVLWTYNKRPWNQKVAMAEPYLHEPLFKLQFNPPKYPESHRNNKLFFHSYIKANLSIKTPPMFLPECPESLPYPFSNGEQCCKYSEQANGAPLAYDSDSCRDAAFSECKRKPCKNTYEEETGNFTSIRNKNVSYNHSSRLTRSSTIWNKVGETGKNILFEIRNQIKKYSWHLGLWQLHAISILFKFSEPFRILHTCKTIDDLCIWK